MAAVIPTRDMCCRNCHHVWVTSASLPEQAVHCPNCGLHICGCGCGIDMSEMRSNAVYATRSHYMTLYRAEQAGRVAANQHATRTRVGSRGGDVRSVEHAAELHASFKDEWTAKIWRQIARALVETGGFHADDLAPLEIPEAHTSIIGSQVSKMLRDRFMVNTEVRRASTRAAANARKSFIYRITDHGSRELPKLLARAGATEAQQGEGNADPRSTGAMDDSAPSTGQCGPLPAAPSGAPSSVGADPGEAQLFDVPGDDSPSSTSPYSAEAA